MPTYQTSGDQTISAAPCCYCCPIDVTPCGPQFMYATVSASFCGVKAPYGLLNKEICLNPTSPCEGRHTVCKPESGYPAGPAQCLTAWPCSPDCNTCLGIGGDCQTNWGIDGWTKCSPGVRNEDPIIPEYALCGWGSISECHCTDSGPNSCAGYKCACLGGLGCKLFQTCEESVAGTHYMLQGRGGANPKSGLTYCNWGTYYESLSFQFNWTCQCTGSGGNFGNHPGPVFGIWHESATGLTECERGFNTCDDGYFLCLIYPEPCPDPDFPAQTHPPYCRYANMIDGTILPAKWKPGYHSCGTYIGFGFDRKFDIDSGGFLYRTWGAVDVAICAKVPCTFGTDPEFCPKPFTATAYALAETEWTDVPPNPYESFSLSGFQVYNTAIDSGLWELVRETCCINSMDITPGAILDDDGNPLGPGIMNC